MVKNRIIRNSARCLVCGDEIESTHVHDYSTCSCGNLSVDGGRSYLLRGGDHWVDTSVMGPREPVDWDAMMEEAAKDDYGAN